MTIYDSTGFCPITKLQEHIERATDGGAAFFPPLPPAMLV